MSLISELKAYLVSKGVTTPIFLGYRPESPDKQVSLFDTGGEPPDEVLPDIKRTVQVSIRDTDQDKSSVTAWSLFAILENPENRVVKYNSRKMRIKAMQPPTFINYDTSQRAITVFNLEIDTVGN
jgi:hypothetical protein